MLLCVKFFIFFDFQFAKVLSLRPTRRSLHQQIMEGGRNDLYKIRSIRHGTGVACRQDLYLGDFVCTYPGDLLNASEWQVRKLLPTTDKEFVFQFKWQERDWYIDGSEKNGLGNYLNHSRMNKNVRVKLEVVNGVPYLYFSVVKDVVEAGTELVYEYDKEEKSLAWMANS